MRWKRTDRKSTRLNSSHPSISYAVFFLSQPPPRPTLLPYTTLFRSDIVVGAATSRLTGDACQPYGFHWAYDTHALAVGTGGALVEAGGDTWFFMTADYAFGYALEKDRSEEHTSELQSPVHLVCRFLPEPAAAETYSLALHDALPI